MDRERLEALERRVAELRAEVATASAAASAESARKPISRRGEISTLVLAVGVLMFFVLGRDVGVWHAGRLPCSARPARFASVTLERQGCAGACPAYDVTLTTDGSVTWNGVAHVARRGVVHRTAAPADVRDLVASLTRGCFFDLRSSYDVPVTTVVRLDVDGRRRAVEHGPRMALAGCAMPIDLGPIEARIDEIAGTKALIGDGVPAPPTGCDRASEMQDHACMTRAIACAYACTGTLGCVDRGAEGTWAVLPNETTCGWDVAHFGGADDSPRRASFYGVQGIDLDGGRVRAKTTRCLVGEGRGCRASVVDTCLEADDDRVVDCVRARAPKPPAWLPARLGGLGWLDGNTTLTPGGATIEATPLRLTDARGEVRVLAGPTLQALEVNGALAFDDPRALAADRRDCDALPTLEAAKPDDRWRVALCDRLRGREVSAIGEAWARAAGEALPFAAVAYLQGVTPWSAH